MRTLWTSIFVVAATTPVLQAEGNVVVVVLDDSGSMSERMQSDGRRKIEAAKQALLTVLDRLPPESQLGVVVLNRGGWIIPLGPLDQQSFRGRIAAIRADGATPLGRFMKVGADALLKARAEQRYGTFKLLIVTDGEATDPGTVEAYLPDILGRGITVDVIGVDMERDHSLATEVHTYRRADNPESLEQAIAEVVLSESTADSRDTDESDFEWLEGLPDEVAAAAVNALAEPNNEPIRALPVAPSDRTVNVSIPAGGSSWRNFSVLTLLTTCCGMGCVLVVVVLGIGFVLVSKR